MMLKVFTDIGESEPVPLIAKVFEHKGKTYTIRYLSPTEDRQEGKAVHKYEEDEYQITDESIMEYYSGDENQVGFKQVEDGFIKEDSDSDYESETETETDSADSESVVDSEIFSDESNE
jgi:hypothetical protein